MNIYTFLLISASLNVIYLQVSLTAPARVTDAFFYLAVDAVFETDNTIKIEDKSTGNQSEGELLKQIEDLKASVQSLIDDVSLLKNRELVLQTTNEELKIHNERNSERINQLEERLRSQTSNFFHHDNNEFCFQNNEAAIIRQNEEEYKSLI